MELPIQAHESTVYFSEKDQDGYCALSTSQGKPLLPCIGNMHVDLVLFDLQIR